MWSLFGLTKKVVETREGLILVMTHWQEQIKKIRFYVEDSSFINQVPNLDRIADWLDGYLENIDFNKNGIYCDGVLETFFLKLSQHVWILLLRRGSHCS